MVVTTRNATGIAAKRAGALGRVGAARGRSEFVQGGKEKRRSEVALPSLSPSGARPQVLRETAAAGVSVEFLIAHAVTNSQPQHGLQRDNRWRREGRGAAAWNSAPSTTMAASTCRALALMRTVAEQAERLTADVRIYLDQRRVGERPFGRQAALPRYCIEKLVGGAHRAR